MYCVQQISPDLNWLTKMPLSPVQYNHSGWNITYLILICLFAISRLIRLSAQWIVADRTKPSWGFISATILSVPWTKSSQFLPKYSLMRSRSILFSTGAWSCWILADQWPMLCQILWENSYSMCFSYPGQLLLSLGMMWVAGYIFFLLNHLR